MNDGDVTIEQVELPIRVLSSQATNSTECPSPRDSTPGLEVMSDNDSTVQVQGEDISIKPSFSSERSLSRTDPHQHQNLNDSATAFESDKGKMSSTRDVSTPLKKPDDGPSKRAGTSPSRASGREGADALRRQYREYLRDTIFPFLNMVAKLFAEIPKISEHEKRSSHSVGAPRQPHSGPDGPSKEANLAEGSSNLEATQTSGPVDEAVEHSHILRTVITQRGPSSKGDKSFVRMSEQDYENIEKTDPSMAFEMQKHVATIKPTTSAKGLKIVGNAALDNEFVDYVASEKIIIRSPQLLKIIKDNVYWPSSAFYEGQKRLELNYPYRAIGVHRDKLECVLSAGKQQLQERQSLTHGDMGQKQPDTTAPDEGLEPLDLALTMQHLELFLTEINKVQRESMDIEKERHNRGFATFDMLWMLIKPGMTVYSRNEEATLACRVKILIWNVGVVSHSTNDDPYQKVDIVLWYLDHNGTHIHRRAHTVSINRYHGEKEICQLPVYPEKFHPNSEQERTTRINRGRNYLKHVKKHSDYCRYQGLLSLHAKDPYKRQSHQNFVGEVIVDPEQYHNEHGLTPGSNWLGDGDILENSTAINLKDYIKLPITHEFGDDQCFLLSEWVRGFTMATHGDRIWVWLHVDRISKYSGDQNLISRVALKKEDLELIKAMTYKPEPKPARGEKTVTVAQGDGTKSMENGVESRDSIWSPEPIENKGRGRIVILHGPPGLGKTYSVECAAAWSGRPLFRLTCAELGLDATALERRLEEHLHRAERWEAIVLIDEADVYMTKRREEGNYLGAALVSVFLRKLEYYSGIIFLTTNRIDAVDKAVIDRALLIIEYTPLDETRMEKIVNNCLKRFENQHYFELDEEAKKLLKTSVTPEKYDWDGREIIQTLTLAGHLAEYDYGREKEDVRSSRTAIIEKKHVENAIKIIRGHAVYKNSVTGEKYPKKAEGYRIDSIG